MGRLSFSRVGDEIRIGRDVCNFSATASGAGFVFASERRTSRDNPLPAIIMRLLFRRVTDIRYLAFLEVRPANLPRLSNGPPHRPPTVLERDEEGALEGSIIFLSAGRAATKTIRKSIRKIAKRARRGR